MTNSNRLMSIMYLSSNDTTTITQNECCNGQKVKAAFAGYFTDSVNGLW